MAPPLFVNTRLANKTGKGKSFWQYLANQFLNEFWTGLTHRQGHCMGQPFFTTIR